VFRGCAWHVDLVIHDPQQPEELVTILTDSVSKSLPFLFPPPPPGTVAFNCPQTNLPVNTGLWMSPEFFPASEIENCSIGPCPYCGQTHQWSKKDAYLYGIKPDGDKPS
jgi:hypothetical protein